MIGGGAMVVCVWRQLVLQRVDSALLDLRVFRSRMFTISLIVFALLMLTLFGAIGALFAVASTFLVRKPEASAVTAPH